MLKYKEIKVVTEVTPKCSILMIYTGGTVGMRFDKNKDTLVPFEFEHFVNHIPQLQHLAIDLTVFALDKLLDSSNITPKYWIGLAKIIEEQYNEYDGFVILHGTDTMAYSASALSFLLSNLSKPVVFTGSQIPIGATRNDAKENVLTALEIVADQDYDTPSLNEVCIYFHDLLLRGNRAKKVQSSYLDAFQSDNYPYLAKAGITIDYNENALFRKRNLPFKSYSKLDDNVVILKLFPGISKKVVTNMLSIPNLKGVVLETFGAGNTMTAEWFIKAISQAIEKGILIYNVSQCDGGNVVQGKYETSLPLLRKGVVNGGDITTEAAITKMMFVLANVEPKHHKNYLEISLRGELTNS